MKLLKHIVKSVRSAANYNPEAESSPQCILWTDKEKLWEKTIIHFKKEMPELLTFGDYEPEHQKGPAIWLRVAIAGLIKNYEISSGRVPILYLPGISRQELRAVEQCPDEIKPLAELQYRGVIWSQINARDWTPYAYLITEKGGLGLNIKKDDKTLEALERALLKLLYEDIDDIKQEYLDKDFFNSLITGGDIVRDILMWMNNPEDFKSNRTTVEWKAFVNICESKYNFNPEHDGIYGAAEKIAWKENSWDIVWDRFCEAPAKYSSVSQILGNIPIKIGVSPDRLPLWNKQQEDLLRKGLKSLKGMPEHSARTKIFELEKEHSERRGYIWTEVGDSQLASALYWLNLIADLTRNPIVGSTSEIIQAYREWGWKVDYAVTNALQSVTMQDDIEAVMDAIRSLYITWADESARKMQRVIKNGSYILEEEHIKYNKDECVFFIDGLRFDIAKQLSQRLVDSDFKVKEATRVAKLPTVTSTCKPLLTPVSDQFIGLEDDNEDFCPVLKDSGYKVTSQRINKLMIQKGWKLLKNGNLSKEVRQNGWFEYSHIDKDGHNLGWRITNNINRYLDEIIENIIEIFNNGWKSIRIVTDHGWLMVPIGLPKTKIAASLVDSKWGRCAAIKKGALYEGNYYQWYWNKNVQFALADGIRCYRASTEYTHGGISPQESIVLDLNVTRNSENKAIRNIQLTDVVWRGMRCKVAAEGQYDSMRLDMRSKPAMSETSIVMGVKTFDSDGRASVVVDEDSYEGKNVYLVILDEEDNVVCQTTTVVGGDMNYGI